MYHLKSKTKKARGGRKNKSALRSYRRRVKSSRCRGKSVRACRGSAGCYVVSGKRRKFCRKYKNTRRSRK